MLICDICNSNLVMDGSREFATCKGCGMEYSKDALRSMLSGTAQAAPAPATGEADRLAENGEQFMKLKEYDKAQKVYAQLMTSHPEDWRGWWGLFVIQITTANFSKFDDFVQNEKYAQNAFAVAGAMQGAIRQQYDMLWDGFLAQLQTPLMEKMFPIMFETLLDEHGSVDVKKFTNSDALKNITGISSKLLSFMAEGRMNAYCVAEKFGTKDYANRVNYSCENPHKYPESYPFLRYLGKPVLIPLEEYPYRYGYGSMNILFCFERIFICVVNIPVAEYTRHHLNCFITDQPIDYSSLNTIIPEEIAPYRKRWAAGKCPFCGGDYFKDIFGDYCKNCKPTRRKAEKYMSKLR